ncbi:hypothetical protein D3C75_601690 [compost metagenome]
MIPGRVVKRRCRLQTRDIIIGLRAQHIVSDMIRHNVDNHLNAESMRGIYQLFQLFFGPEVRISGIGVLDVVSVIGCVFTCAVVVAVSHLRLCHRGDPNCGITHVSNIRELVDNPLPVAALHIAEILLRGLSVTDRGAGGIIGGIPIIKTVDHNLINRVVLSDCADAGRICLRRCQHE